jgi:hypothetical protein
MNLQERCWEVEKVGLCDQHRIHRNLEAAVIAVRIPSRRGSLELEVEQRKQRQTTSAQGSPRMNRIDVVK